MKKLEETLQILRVAAEKTDAVAVSYSAGKDAMAVLDLCSRVFKRVEAFYLYLVPGLDCIDLDLAAAEARYGIKVRQYPTPWLAQLLKLGVFCPPHYKFDDLPNLKLKDIYRVVRYECNVKVIANGFKRCDSLDRRDASIIPGRSTTQRRSICARSWRRTAWSIRRSSTGVRLRRVGQKALR